MMRLIALLAVFVAGWTLPVAVSAQQAPGFTPQPSAFTAQQREEMQQIIREYLLDHPEAVLDALTTMQKREQQVQQDQQKLTVANSKGQLFAAPEDGSLGNPKAKTVIVEFVDYRCPYCKGISANLRKLVEEDKELRIVLKELPILGPDSIYAAKASLAARDHAKFAEFHSAMIAAHGPLNETTVGKIAASFGIDFAKLKKQMDAPETQAVIDRNLALARSLGISGTPAFVIGSSVYPGAMENDILKRLIRTARAQG